MTPIAGYRYALQSLGGFNGYDLFSVIGRSKRPRRMLSLIALFRYDPTVSSRHFAGLDDNIGLWFAQEGDELIILDQHGAHERILYERLLKNPEGTPVALPSPVVVRLPEDLAPEAWNFEVELRALGFEFEPFGEGAVRVSKVPETVADPEAALVAALSALAGGEDLAKALACKGSTRFGENLSREEMEALLIEWSSCQFGEICPHGRPIVKRIRLADLLREFGRL